VKENDLMANKISWDKKLSDLAKSQRQALWAVGYAGRAGRWEAWGKMSDEHALLAFFFVQNLYHKMAPMDALSAAMEDAGLTTEGEPSPVAVPSSSPIPEPPDA
jgi:hypothetical protein